MNPYIGHPNQLCGYHRFCFSEGAMKGLEAVEVFNSTGLRFMVLLGRGMDIGEATYKGKGIAYITPAGYVSSAHFQNGGSEWLRAFAGGLLVTCGLCNVGPGCETDGASYGLHGRFSSLAAEQVSIQRLKISGQEAIEIKGVVRQASLFFENFEVRRTIRTYGSSNRIEIEDEVINNSFKAQPLMLLYHCNFGYPLLCERTVLDFSAQESKPRDEEAEKGMDSMKTIFPPQPGFSEQVFFHKGVSEATLASPDMSVIINWDAESLPCFTQWKMFGQGEYVLGLEPGNCNPIGRKAYLESGEAEYLEPGEVKHTRLSFVIEDKAGS